MWTGVFPAVTTKFTEDDRLDHKEMERCFGLQVDAGVDGLIVCGSLGEGPMLSHDEKLELAARNLPYVDVLPVSSLDPLSLARHDHVLATAGAVRLIEERLA